MAGPPRRQRLSALSTGSAAQSPAPGTGSAHCLPESLPNIQSDIPRPTASLSVTARAAVSIQLAASPPLAAAPRISGQRRCPRYKSLPPFSSGFAESPSCRTPAASARPYPSPRDARHTPPAHAPPARPLRCPALYWQGVRAVCGRSLPLPTREVYHGRPAMHPHPPFLPLL